MIFMDIEFSPLEAFKLALRRWWLIAIFLLAGGLLGWGFSRLHTPLYDAQALLVINIDYLQFPELTQKTDDHYTEDQITGAASGIVISSAVLDQVGAALKADGVSVDWENYTRNLSLERKRSQFWLRVRDADPQRAAQVANLWIEKAYATLVEYHQHAVNAKVLRDYLAGMSACMPSTQDEVVPESPYPPPEDKNQSPAYQKTPEVLYLPEILYTLMPSLCGSGTLDEIQQAVQAATAQMEAETIAGNALSPALTFSLLRKAPVPTTPVAYRASLLLVVGALLGAAVGLAVIPFTGRNRPRQRADRQGS
jgi:capsular polysaccharide biosynthesis protein